jgi:hypothetical protein
MKIKIRLSEKHSECPNALKGFFSRLGCKFPSAANGLIKEFRADTISEFNGLEFLTEEDLLTQPEWLVEADESEKVAVMAINGRPVAATIDSQIRGADGGIAGKADLSDQCIGGFLKPLPAEIRHIGIFSCDNFDFLAGLTELCELDTKVAWWYGDKTDSIGCHPVGDKKPNELGIYDMSGNAMEFGWDTTNFSPRVRGGSWKDYSYDCRLCDRSVSADPSFCSDEIGFRLVRNSSNKTDSHG